MEPMRSEVGFFLTMLVGQYWHKVYLRSDKVADDFSPVHKEHIHIKLFGGIWIFATCSSTAGINGTLGRDIRLDPICAALLLLAGEQHHQVEGKAYAIVKIE